MKRLFFLFSLCFAQQFFFSAENLQTQEDASLVLQGHVLLEQKELFSLQTEKAQVFLCTQTKNLLRSTSWGKSLFLFGEKQKKLQCLGTMHLDSIEKHLSAEGEILYQEDLVQIRAKKAELSYQSSRYPYKMTLDLEDTVHSRWTFPSFVIEAKGNFCHIEQKDDHFLFEQKQTPFVLIEPEQLWHLEAHTIKVYEKKQIQIEGILQCYLPKEVFSSIKNQVF